MLCQVGEHLPHLHCVQGRLGKTRDPSHVRKHTRQNGKPLTALSALQDSYLLFRDIAANQDGTGEATIHTDALSDALSALLSESIIIQIFG